MLRNAAKERPSASKRRAALPENMCARPAGQHLQGGHHGCGRDLVLVLHQQGGGFDLVQLYQVCEKMKSTLQFGSIEGPDRGWSGRR